MQNDATFAATLAAAMSARADNRARQDRFNSTEIISAVGIRLAELRQAVADGRQKITALERQVDELRGELARLADRIGTA
jgi:TolA-binding protein